MVDKELRTFSKDIQDRPAFGKMQIDKLQSIWENAFWTNETKLELFVNSHQLMEN